MELSVQQQMELTQRLIAACAGKADGDSVMLTAGELRALLFGLASLAGFPAAPPEAADQVWPPIEALLREHPQGLRLCQIHRALRLPKHLVLTRLRRRGCEKIAGTHRWRLPERRELLAAQPVTE